MTQRLPETTGMGEIFRLARINQGISQETMARELNLPLSLLVALETDDWSSVPTGRERPLARLLARRLGLDLEQYRDAWELVPGPPEQEPPNPKRERMEQLLTASITAGSILVLLWLVVPGRNIKKGSPPPKRSIPAHLQAPWTPQAPPSPYPVLGEVLPEAPITAEGALVSMRAMDNSSATIQSSEGTRQQTLAVSQPWHLRVKGSFVITLQNAGVVTLEVAGQRIRHGRNVGDTWSGTFSAEGKLQLPNQQSPGTAGTAPETDTEAESEAASE